MCFATPAHNDTLDGSWVPRTQPGNSTAHLEPCHGFHMKLGSWPFADSFRCNARDQYFVPRTCHLPEFDAADFLRLVGRNHTLWFVGDSVSGQMFATVAYLLSANSVIQVEEVTPDFDVRELVMHKREGDKGAWCFVAHGARTCYLSVWNLTHTDTFYTLMTRIGLQPLDNIVLNVGVRASSTPGFVSQTPSRKGWISPQMIHVPACSA